MKMVEKTTIDITSFVEYKTCLRKLLNDRKSEFKGQRSALARAMGCQPAYLARVLNGSADLSLEQMTSAAQYFALTPAQTRYLVSLLGYNRAGTQALKSFWEEQMIQASSDQKELKGRLRDSESLTQAQIRTYYSSWHYAAIHMAAGLKKSMTDRSITQLLSLPMDLTRTALAFLVDAGLLEKNGIRYARTDRRIHLSRKDPMVLNHHVNWKLKTVESLARPDESGIHYSSVVSISRDDLRQLQELMLTFAEKARAIVKDSDDELVACYTFDCFEVGHLTERY
ncbi:MAG: TIGR02147 family protein [Bdellovibrionaceae bacterium]|nr:TIGR02147 family protein [Pseudobdellovibrionaceae bacterium]MBX3032972.1 TIGR02147 family protein [Pseudobdellovibrionaceae bacterium]